MKRGWRLTFWEVSGRAEASGASRALPEVLLLQFLCLPGYRWTTGERQSEGELAGWVRGERRQYSH